MSAIVVELPLWAVILLIAFLFAGSYLYFKWYFKKLAKEIKPLLEKKDEEERKTKNL